MRHYVRFDAQDFSPGLILSQVSENPWKLKCMLWGISYPEMIQSTPMYQISHVQQSPGPLSTRSETVDQELSLGNRLFRIGRRSDCLDPLTDNRHTWWRILLTLMCECKMSRWSDMCYIPYCLSPPKVKAVKKSNWKVHQKISIFSPAAANC